LALFGSAAMLVTQCPVCGTGFKVTLEELSVADGALQCGHCQAFFNADDIPEFSEGYEDQPGDSIEAPIDFSEGESALAGSESVAPESGLFEAQEESLSASDGMVDSPLDEPVNSDQLNIDELEDDQVDLSRGANSSQSELPKDHSNLAARTSSAGPLKGKGGDVATMLKRLHLPHSRSLWGVLLLALLLIQLLWIAGERLYQTPLLYGAAKVFCNAVGCKLDRFEDLALLSLGDVNMTPWQAGRARVTARLTNSAGFAQDLPNLLFTLSDKTGQVIAARTLEGQKDYRVSGRQKLMIEAVGEVRIEFDVAEEASYGRAVSYQMELVNRP